MNCILKIIYKWINNKQTSKQMDNQLRMHSKQKGQSKISNKPKPY